MSQAKREMFEAQDKLQAKKIRKEELLARVSYLESLIRMYQGLENAFGYCHPDLQVARMTKTDAIKIHERMERDRREEVMRELAQELGSQLINGAFPGGVEESKKREPDEPPPKPHAL